MPDPTRSTTLSGREGKRAWQLYTQVKLQQQLQHMKDIRAELLKGPEPTAN
jgi:hypothetical protein